MRDLVALYCRGEVTHSVVYGSHLYPQWMFPLALFHTRVCAYTRARIKNTLSYKGFSIRRSVLSALTESHEHQGLFVSFFVKPTCDFSCGFKRHL